MAQWVFKLAFRANVTLAKCDPSGDIGRPQLPQAQAPLVEVGGEAMAVHAFLNTWCILQVLQEYVNRLTFTQ